MDNFISSIQGFMSNLLAGISDWAEILIYIAIILLTLFVVYFIRIHIAVRMAKNRHRDPLGWALCSFFVSPLLTWIILLIAGDAK